MQNTNDRDILTIDEIFDGLIEKLQHGEDVGEQIYAMQMLTDLGAQKAVSALIPFLAGEDEVLRVSAIEALAFLGHRRVEEVGPAIERLLSDPEDLVRDQAAEALGVLRFSPARLPLEQALLHDRDWVTRASAAWSLGELGDPRALPALEAALADEHYPVRSYTIIAMEQLGGARVLPSFREQLAAELHRGPRARLLTAILRMGDASVFDDLLALIRTVEAPADPADPAVDDEPVRNVLDAVQDFLSDKVPPVVGARAAELAQALAELGRRAGKETYAAELTARVEELRAGG